MKCVLGATIEVIFSDILSLDENYGSVLKLCRSMYIH